MKRALLIIDVQNDYFASQNGAFPQWNVDELLKKIIEHAHTAQNRGELVIGVQHLTPENSPIFAKGSHGANIHSDLNKILKNQPIVQKNHADSFLKTNLSEILKNNQITHLDICGIMTQNCVTHTALSPFAQDWKIRVLSDLCTAPSELIHLIALDALKDRDWIEIT